MYHNDHNSGGLLVKDASLPNMIRFITPQLSQKRWLVHYGTLWIGERDRERESENNRDIAILL